MQVLGRVVGSWAGDLVSGQAEVLVQVSDQALDQVLGQVSGLGRWGQSPFHGHYLQ